VERIDPRVPCAEQQHERAEGRPDDGQQLGDAAVDPGVVAGLLVIGEGDGKRAERGARDHPASCASDALF